MITIIDSGGENIASILFCLQRLGVSAQLSNDAARIKQSSHIILPGVGTAPVGMRKLKANGLVELIRSLTQPVLGICLGMHLLFDSSEEGDVECLGIIPSQITKLSLSENIVIPHMGWNSIDIIADCELLKNIQNQDYTYFVHSYVAPINPHTVAVTSYGKPFSSVISKENFFGTQFHPEKSGDTGKQILKNFLEL